MHLGWKLLTAAGWLSIFLCGSCRIRTAYTVLIPEGYKGWVEIRFGIAGQPSLHREGGNFVIEVPKSGRLSTSAPLVAGYANDKYYFVSESGGKTEIPVEIHGCNSGVCISHILYVWQPVQAADFFVGREADLSKFPEPLPPQ